MGSYVRGNLMPGEQVVKDARPHWIYLLLPFLTIFIGIGFIWFPIALISFFTTEIGLTNKRLMIKTGFIRREAHEIPLDRVETLNVEQSVLERFVFAGKLVVTAGGEKLRPPTIWKPREFRNDVMQEQEQYKRSLYSGRG